MKRMTIQGYTPPPPVDPADAGLPPRPELPTRDGLMRIKFIGRFTLTDAWGSEALIQFGKRWARAALAMQDVEIHVLTTERDALKAELDELRASR